jgi:hypothetical protein
MAAARHMREYLAHHLYGTARLDDVRVVKDKHYRKVALLVVTPDGYLRPQLAVDIVHDLAPLCTAVVKEVVEYVLMTAHEIEERAVCVVCRISDRETGEHQQ